jgi:hypothetical protein
VEGKTEGRRKTHQGRLRDPRLAEPISEKNHRKPALHAGFLVYPVDLHSVDRDGRMGEE